MDLFKALEEGNILETEKIFGLIYLENPTLGTKLKTLLGKLQYDKMQELLEE